MILRSTVICLFFINAEGIRLFFINAEGIRLGVCERLEQFIVPNLQTVTMKVVLP
jgi:hypothetical protein